MNIVRRLTVVVHRRPLELLLVLATTLLFAQLFWPVVRYWWRLPSPGRIGCDTFQSATLANEFVIQLPESYHGEQLWPLVVFLHGSGECGNDPTIVRAQQLFRQRLPAIVAAPQCLPDYNWQPNSVADLVHYVASQYHVDRRRIYLVGYSMGGYGAWQSAAAHPDLFAAIVPISRGGEPDDAKALAGVSVWAFHGEKDTTIPLADSKSMIEALRNAAGQPRLTILPEAGHDICRAVCARRSLGVAVSAASGKIRSNSEPEAVLRRRLLDSPETLIVHIPNVA